MKWLHIILLLCGPFISIGLKGQVHTQFTNGFLNDYWVYTPTGYESNSDLYPVLYYFHGAASISFDPSTVLDNHGPPLMIDDGDWDTSLPFIVVSPHLSRDLTYPNHVDQRWSTDTLKNILDEVKLNFRVDPNRVYVTGISNGGKAVWDYVQTYPSEVAAAVVIAGNGVLADVCNSSDVPIRAFHGDLDGLIPISGSNDATYFGPIDLMVALEGCTSPAPWTHPLLTVFEGFKHNGWNQTYNRSNGYDIYDYLLNFTKGDFSNVTPHVTAGDAYRKILLPGGEFVIDGYAFDYDGSITSYTWTKEAGPAVTMTPDTSTLILTNLNTGTYTFRLTVEDDDGATNFDEIDLEVVGSISGHAITDLVLVNADTEQDIMVMSDNQVIDFLTIGTDNLNIRADNIEDGKPVSIRFGVDFNRNFRTEGFGQPRSLAGDNNNTGTPAYSSWTPTLGQHVISATIYDQRNGLGNEGISLFYRIQVSNDGSPLPVEFGKFYGRAMNGGNMLFWETITETDNSHFTVEFASDDLEFRSLGMIQGNGTTSEKNTYSYFHDNPEVKSLKYRIKQTDFDGKSSYSKTIRISNRNLGSIRVFYKANDRELVIENPEELEFEYRIISLSGKEVLNGYSDTSTRLSVPHFKSGLYTVQVVGRQSRTIKKVVIF